MNQETTVAENQPKTYDIISVRSAEAMDLFGEKPETAIKEILKGMVDIVPLEFSMMFIDDILEKLATDETGLNKVWSIDRDGAKEIVGFMICEALSDEEVYIKYLAVKKISDFKAPAELIDGNIRKLISKAQKAGYKKISLHGFNRVLNYLLQKRFGFKADQTKDFSFSKDKKVSYLVLDLEGLAVDPEELALEAFLASINEKFKDQLSDFKVNASEIIRDKLVRYLEKTGKKITKLSAEEQTSLIEAIKFNLAEILMTNLGLYGAIKKLNKQSRTISREKRASLAYDEALPPELIIQQGDLTLFRLVTLSQMKAESAETGNCVGDSEHYIKAFIHGDKEIFSLKKAGEALLTIEYDPKSQTFVQIKNKKNLITGEEAWFGDFVKLVGRLSVLEKPILVKRFSDLNNLSFLKNETNKLMLNSAELVDPTEYFSSKTEENRETNQIFSGVVTLDNNTQPEFLEKVVKEPNLTLRFDESFPQQLKDSITEVHGSIVDLSKEKSRFGSLVYCGGKLSVLATNLDLPEIKMIEGKADLSAVAVFTAPKLKEFGFDINLHFANKVELPSLEVVRGNLGLSSARVVNLPHLRKVFGTIDITDAIEASFPYLERLDQFLAESIEVLSLASLKQIEGDFNFKGQSLNAPVLEVIFGQFVAKNLDSVFLPKLNLVDGSMVLADGADAYLPQLEQINGDFFVGKKLYAPLLTMVKGILNADEVTVLDLPALIEVAGSLTAIRALEVSLPSLRGVFRNVELITAKKIFLPELQFILGRLNIWECVDFNAPKLEFVQEKIKTSNLSEDVFKNVRVGEELTEQEYAELIYDVELLPNN